MSLIFLIIRNTRKKLHTVILILKSKYCFSMVLNFSLSSINVYTKMFLENLVISLTLLIYEIECRGKTGRFIECENASGCVEFMKNSGIEVYWFNIFAQYQKYLIYILGWSNCSIWQSCVQGKDERQNEILCWGRTQ